MNQSEANYDEELVPAYTLPDPLTFPDGAPVADAATWVARRRPEVLALFEEHVYGRSPGRPERVDYAVESDVGALEGRATRRQVRVTFGNGEAEARVELLLYLPSGGPRPAPVFLGLNFAGNHAIHPDPAIRLSTAWMRPNVARGVQSNRATEYSRGAVASRWDGPYLNTDTVPVDPWGMPYGYAYPPTRGAGPKHDIWSFGPDNQDGTEDDIVNWSRAATGAGQMPGQMPGQEGMTSEQLGGGLGPDAMPGPPPIDQGMPPMGQDMPPMQPMTPPAQPMTQPAMP
mgnify:CR=1 FL=1